MTLELVPSVPVVWSPLTWIECACGEKRRLSGKIVAGAPNEVECPGCGATLTLLLLARQDGSQRIGGLAVGSDEDVGIHP
jgi:hypothetical protein